MHHLLSHTNCFPFIFGRSGLNLIFVLKKHCPHLQYGLSQTLTLYPIWFELLPSSPQHQFGLFQTPSTGGYFMAKPGKGLTSCTTMYLLTPASPSLVSLATCHVLTSQRTRIMTVSGPPIVTGLPRFLVRYWCRKTQTHW